MNAVEQKADEIHRDLEANVVKIPQRRDLMWLVDIVYHSPLAFHFQKSFIKKGVAEAVIIGDTRVGKSHTVEHMMGHYGFGEFITGESVTQAGLLGGIDENGKRRFVRYGLLPLNHRQLVAMDEANEMSEELIGRMSGVRSSGLYTMQKIVSARIACLVRMIWIANPRTKKKVGDFSYGVQAVADLVPRPEDVARFDLATVISTDDVDRAFLYQREDQRRKVRHNYTSDVCRTRIHWVWSRRPDQWLFTSEAEDAVLTWSNRLCRDFDDSIPLVVETEQRIKVARCAASVAGMVFSHVPGDWSTVLVDADHVDAACHAMLRLYRHPSMGYDTYSRAQKGVEVSDDIARVLRALGKSGVTHILNTQSVTERDLATILSDKAVAKEAMRLLVLGHGIGKEGRYGRWGPSPSLISAAKAMLEDLDAPERPDPDRISPRPSGGEEPRW